MSFSLNNVVLFTIIQFNFFSKPKAMYYSKPIFGTQNPMLQILFEHQS